MKAATDSKLGCRSLHHMPSYWRDIRVDNRIITECNKCGGFIGSKHANTK